ncbi:MAG: hypothetical protein JWQ90_2878 [Hydrocarboniphaga sp.]|uniref:Calx-beta domain-containing protein n=1 Tax=Hydrocarboniphaga sp. TaxID=2033016 RepID=UPI0026249AAC|nr:Calx-beta domain-containing protein [Hydrocarboniphaga sp.]MDB5970428.1 hypothetical protein [Hydrocarboniphaga sp.]
MSHLLSPHRLRRISRQLLPLLCLLAAPLSMATSIPAQPDARQIDHQYAQLPLAFEVNHGQFDAPVRYLAQGQGYTIFLTAGETVLSLQNRKGGTAERAAIRTTLVGANPSPVLATEDLQPGRSNYFRGNDPARWVRNVEHFGRVRYQGVYPGVDLVYYGNQGQLEYDFVVAPNADPRRIRMHYAGVQGGRLGPGGDLSLRLADGELVLKKPELYQQVDGRRVAVPGRYTFKRRGKGVDVAFELGRYDRARSLVIDPVLVYSTYLGGSGLDAATGIAVGSTGQAYVTGYTASTNFPTQLPLQGGINGTGTGTAYDVFVSKFSADGQTLIYSTYLGGTAADQANGIAVNAAGDAYVTGKTYSFDFPLKSALFATHAGDPDPEGLANNDVFVSRLSADGQNLLYSTFLGGSSDDVGYAITTDSSGQIYVAGQTSSVISPDPEDPSDPTTLFPTQSARQPLPGSTGSPDAFVAVLAADGKSLVFSTFLGGSTSDTANSIAVDASQRVFVTGSTQSPDFPVQSAAQASIGGGTSDAFVTAYVAGGQSYVYSSYLGGSGTDIAYGIAVGADGRAYVTGSTASANFPTTPSALDPSYGGTSAADAFVTIFASDGSGPTYSSYLGGSTNVTDVGRAIALDGAGNIYVTGFTNSSTDFPLQDAVQSTYAGGTDAFITEFAPNAASIVFSSFLGGKTTDQGFGIAVDAAGAQIYVAGVTNSTNFPTTPSPLQGTIVGGYDAFVARIGSPTVISAGQLSLGSSSYSVIENGGQLSISVSRSGGSSGAASVDYASTNGTATAGSDYVAQSGTLDWADGDATDKIISLEISDDSQLEPDETFGLSLSGVSGATLGSPAAATITITNDDAARPGTLQFDASTYFVDEAGGSLLVSVTRADGSDGAASVSYATSGGTATAGTDYQAVSGTLDWADGDASPKTFSVPIDNDTAVEANETFNLALSAVSGATLGDPALATATIADDESLQPGTLQLGAASYSVGESAGNLSVTVTRQIGSDGAVSVQYTTGGGTATAGSDYTAASGKLSWADGDTAAKTITITIDGDALFEGAETFGLTLGAVTGGAVLGSPSAATATIVDDDVALNGSIQLSASTYQVTEDGGALQITVNRVDGSDGAVSVKYATSSGTATSNSDFTATSGTLNWAAGDAAAKTVSVPILQDSVYEGRETFGFTLSSASGGAALGSPATATVTLVDDEVQRGTLQLSDSQFTVAEAGGSVTLSVLRENGSDGAVSIGYSTADATASSPADYTGQSGTLSWSDGDAAPKSIVVPIVDDTDYEGAETFAVKLASPSGGAALGTPDTATVTIQDNEIRPGSLQLDAPTYRVVENTGVVKITVMRVGGTDNAVSVRYSTNQGTAVSGNDYNAISGTLNWDAGDATPRTLTVQILDDSSFEGDETLSIALSEPTGGATLGGPATATITIADNEVAFAGGIRMGASAYEVDEASGSVALAVVRGGSSTGTVSVAYSTVNGQAVSGSDYIANSGRLTWADGDLEPKTIAVQILSDSSVEGSENFSVVLSNPTGGVALDTPSSASVSITDASSGEGSGSSGKNGGGALDPRWLAVLLMAGLWRKHRRA